MNFLIKVFFYLSLLVNFFLNSQNEQLNLISFDRIFPETKLEQIQKNLIDMFKLINDFKNNKEKKILNKFLEDMFNCIINYYFFINFLNNQKKMGLLLCSDIHNQKIILNNIFDLFKNITQGYKSNKKSCIDFIFKKVLLKLENINKLN